MSATYHRVTRTTGAALVRLRSCRPTADLAWAHGAQLPSNDLLDGPWPRHPLVGPEHLSKLIRVAGLTRAGARRGAVPLS